MAIRRLFIASLTMVCLLAGGLLFLAVRSSSPPSPGPAAAPRASKSAAASVVMDSGPSVRAPRVQTEDPWALRWSEWLARPEGEARDQALAALVAELAAADPMRAIALADGETNGSLRDTLLQAALRGWGGVSPEVALAWATAQTLLDSGEAMASVFHGAAHDPENLLRLTGQWSQQDPDRAGDYGSYLVAALNRAGDFSQAATYAAAVPSEFRLNLLNAAYAGWADREPKAALEAIGQLPDPEIKKTAFAATISRWANNDAPAAAAYARELPEGSERMLALTVALRNWAAVDGVGAATWMSGLEPSPELDMGAAVVAALPESLQQPEVAAGWAESIVDPQLRARVLAAVVKEWSATDPAAARAYAESSPDIRAEDRATVLSAFDPDFNPISVLP